MTAAFQLMEEFDGRNDIDPESHFNRSGESLRYQKFLFIRHGLHKARTRLEMIK